MSIDVPLAGSSPGPITTARFPPVPTEAGGSVGAGVGVRWWRGVGLAVLAGLLGLAAAGAAVWLSPAGWGRLIEFAFPLGSVAAAMRLYRRRPGAYVAFVWWLVFLTPEVRRVVDWLDGYSPVSFIMLAPLLASSLAVQTLLERTAGDRRMRTSCLLALAGIGYGYAVGLLRQGPAVATFDLLQWTAPVLFGLYVAQRWRVYPTVRSATIRAFALGLLLMGVYGVVQLLVVPPWDGYWMDNVEMSSIGVPEPMRVRVFSTMNSPGPYAMVTACGLLLLMGAGREAGAARWPAVAAGAAGLLLSLARTAWLGWLVGVLVLIGFADKKDRLSLVGVLLGVGLLAAGSTALLPATDVVTERVASMGDVSEDHSFQERMDFTRSLRGALLDPVGQGLGSTGTAVKLKTHDTLDFDNGLANVPYVLGWPGGLLFAAGVFGVMRAALRRPGRGLRITPMGAAAVASAVAVLSMMISSNTLLRPVGMLFWAGVGLAVAGAKHRSVAASGQAPGGPPHGSGDGR